ncbi:hypothetical protein KO465_01390 [Candidatus Micrarchaeota archaeon]|jgi:hypothetical protein|nr:hypothetical protein [Candidatus Micrarchaeota archaeon]
MTFEITHPEKPTETDKIDDNDYMLPHAINGVLPDFSSFPNMKARIPILIEEKSVPLDTTEITFSNLDGDTDQLYYITGEINLVRVSTNGIIYIQVNNDDVKSNYSGVQIHYYNGSSGVTSTSIPTTELGLRVLQDRSGDQICDFEVTLYSKKGKERKYHAINHHYSPTVAFVTNNTAIWKNTTDNITSLTFKKTSGSFSGVIKLYKMVDINLQNLL